MTSNKKCRHVAAAWKAPALRKALKDKEAIECETCLKNEADEVTTAEKPKKKPPQELLICVTCGFCGCRQHGHFDQHVKHNTKHFVAFEVVHKCFWCNTCKHEMVDEELSNDPKTLAILKECQTLFEYLMRKRERQQKQQRRMPVLPKPPSLATSAELPVASPASMDATAADSEESEQHFAEIRQPKSKQQLRAEKKRKAKEDQDARRAAKREQEQQQEKKRQEQHEAAGKSEIGTAQVVGLSNLGNTCYFNSALQAFLCVVHSAHQEWQEMADLVTESGTTRAPITMTCISFVSTVFATRNCSPRKHKMALNPGLVLKAIRSKFSQFRGYFQQDAHELFVNLLYAIEEELLAIQKDREAQDQPEEEANEETTVVTEQNGDTAHELAEQPSSGTVNDDSQDKEEAPAMQRLLIKTDNGETISLTARLDATMKEIDRLVAERLHLDPRDVFLQPSAPSSQTCGSDGESTKLSTTKGDAKFGWNFPKTLFATKVATHVTCHECGNRSETIEECYQLSLSIPSESSSGVSLDDCLQEFVKPSELLVAKDNGYDCEKCQELLNEKQKQQKQQQQEKSDHDNKHDDTTTTTTTIVTTARVKQDATMGLVIKQMPQVLVLHLKRLCRAKKISARITFGETFDGSSFVASNGTSIASSPLFDLLAVVVHSGNKRSGHYVAYVSREVEMTDKQPVTMDEPKPEAAEDSGGAIDQAVADDDTNRSTTIENATSTPPKQAKATIRKWFFISDSMVREVALDDVLRCEAYMLFYKQRKPTL